MIDKFWHLIEILSFLNFLTVCDITGHPINNALHSMHDIISHSKPEFRNQFKKYKSSGMLEKENRFQIRQI
jgi:hypothetical protein